MNTKTILCLALFALLCNSDLVLSTHWYKLNRSPVCFGARGNTPGTFKSRYSLNAYLIAIYHRSGGVSCSSGVPTAFSCAGIKYLGVFMTNSKNQPIVPKSPTYPDKYKMKGWYYLNGYTDAARNIVLVAGDSCNGHYIAKHETLRVWYGEDLYNFTEHDNSRGRSCVDVYALA